MMECCPCKPCGSLKQVGGSGSWSPLPERLASGCIGKKAILAPRKRYPNVEMAGRSRAQHGATAQLGGCIPKCSWQRLLLTSIQQADMAPGSPVSIRAHNQSCWLISHGGEGPLNVQRLQLQPIRAWKLCGCGTTQSSGALHLLLQ